MDKQHAHKDLQCLNAADGKKRSFLTVRRVSEQFLAPDETALRTGTQVS
jgi:hypothetical protein